MITITFGVLIGKSNGARIAGWFGARNAGLRGMMSLPWSLPMGS